MPEYKWPEAEQRRVIGKPYSRLDGPDKATGKAKYTFDINRPGMLWGKCLICPHARAKIKKIDTSAAEAMSGVKGVLVIQKEGTEVKWHGDEIVMVAAETEERAYDAIREIKVEYDVLPHIVNDRDVEKALKTVVAKDKDGNDVMAAKAADAKVNGDPDAAFKSDDVVILEGEYGIPVIAHCCLESHGVVADWTGEDELTLYCSTQNVSGISGQVSTGLKQIFNVEIPASNIQTICQHVGGGFGSKFGPERHGVYAAMLAKRTGKPVKLMLDRDHEMLSLGARPSGFAKIKMAAKKDGELVAWESTHWGTAGGGAPGTVSEAAMPYVFRTMPNLRTQIIPILTNTGPQKAWRAPNHPQGAALTMTAMADMAAALNMDEIEFLKKNLQFVQTPAGAAAQDIYAQELAIAAEMSKWKERWHPRGDKTPGPIKRGLGISIHTWTGGPVPGNCEVTINPDGSVLLQLGSQDLGTGTRTVLAIVAAETFGLEAKDIRVDIGTSRYVSANGSGGSITVGSVSSTSRRGCLDALEELFKAAAPVLDANPEDLVATGGKVHAKGKPEKSLTWKQACAKLDMKPIKVTGKHPDPNKGTLASGGVCGVQLADVSVDIETGIVKMNEFIAVQDQGLVINPKTCESQILGGVIMGITYALFEEKIADPITGRVLNPDMEFYKLAGIGDIGKIKVHLLSGKFKGPISGQDVDLDAKGVVGNGEPPVISPGAAISNAVANAIGVRVPYLPLTADKVLAALEKKGGVA